MIKLVNVNKTYGKGESAVHALKDVNLELPSGKFIALVGKSGSGKSTLMNIIGALDSVSDKNNSQVIIGDKDITKLKDNELADYRNKKIGYIFQSFYLEPTFSVLENVAMPLTIAGEKKKVREEKAMEAIKKLGLEEKAKKLASELSGGQKQRVSIARALVANPDIVLADEPTGNLDSQNGQEVIKLLLNICDEGKTVGLVTHNIVDARKTDVMVEIKDGVISNIIYNDAEAKKRAQTVTDYDKEGNLIDRNKQENVTEVASTENIEPVKAELDKKVEEPVEKAEVRKAEPIQNVSGIKPQAPPRVPGRRPLQPRRPMPPKKTNGGI